MENIKSIKKRVLNPKWDRSGHMVSPTMLSYDPGTMNLAGKLVARAGILAMFHMRAFGNTHDLIIGKDFSNLIDNPDERHTDNVKQWNDYISFIIRVEEECDYILRLMESVGKARIIPEGQGAEEDIYAHTETLGRWHFDAKKKANKINNK
jgi:hypothetical protein